MGESDLILETHSGALDREETVQVPHKLRHKRQ